MPLIRETVVTTVSAAGVAHLAPLGLIAGDAPDEWIIAPFAPSTTLDNLRAVPEAVASHTDDVRVIAGCLTSRRDWPLAPTCLRPPRLAAALSHWELTVIRVDDDAQRPRFTCRVLRAATHAPFAGFNRAQAAVIEAAILVSRLHLLPARQIADELARLRVAVDKTAGAPEREAWGWLVAAAEAAGAGPTPGA